IRRYAMVSRRSPGPRSSAPTFRLWGSTTISPMVTPERRMMVMVRDTLGDVVAIARRARGLTQAELGQIVGVRQAAINRYEAGEREPEDAIVAALVGALGVTERLLRHGDRFRGALAVDVHMRRQKTTKASAWRRMEARLNLLRMHASFLFEEVSLHSEQRV